MGTGRSTQDMSAFSRIGARPALLLSLAAFSAGAFDLKAAMACELSGTRAGTVADIVDAETLKLTDGTVVRLIGAKAPRAPLS